MTDQESWTKIAWQFIGCSIRLHCPECGISPLFMATHHTESITDWFAHLPSDIKGS